jgi:hypothetical protein
LELIDSTTENNDGTAWQASYTFGGTPGASNSVSGGYECVDCGVGATTETQFADDFESGLTQWTTGDVADFTTTTTDAISTTSLATNAAGAGSSELWADMGCLDITAACTTWNFDLKQQTGWTADGTNTITFVLGSDVADLATANGYAVTLDATYGSGNISLIRLDAGVGSALISGPVSLPDDQAISLEVRHLEDGTWVLLIDYDGGADTFLAANTTVNDSTHPRLMFVGVATDYDATFSAGLRVDNVSVNQCGVAETIYSVASGNSSAAIWNTNPVGTGETAVFNRFKTVEVQAADAVTFDEDYALAAFTNQGSTDLAAQRITLYGDFDDNGSFATAGTVAFKGSSNAAIGGASTTQFNELVVEKDAGSSVSLTSDAGLHGLVHMESGAFDTNGQIFTLHATATSRGCIGEIKADAAWTGDITFETYIPVATEEGYFNLGNPIVGNTLAAWNDDMETTGFPGSDYPNWPSAVDPYINIFHYNETAA